MTDKKFTDKEIIETLKECIELKFDDTEYATVKLDILTNALDLITHQQTENKRLEKEVNLVSIQFQDLQERYEEAQAEIESLKIFRGYAEKRASDYKTMRDKYLNAKSEAVKAFAERLKEFMHNKFKDLDEYEFEYITERDIDNFCKEIVKALKE